MVSDFQKLSEKIIQLADMTQQLRLDNADLRLKAAALSSENLHLSQKMQEAHHRISALMDKYPAPAVKVEAS